jgi:hypothetical protein
LKNFKKKKTLQLKIYIYLTKAPSKSQKKKITTPIKFYYKKNQKKKKKNPQVFHFPRRSRRPLWRRKDSVSGATSGSGRVAVAPVDPPRQRGHNGAICIAWLWLWRRLHGSTQKEKKKEKKS